MKSYSSREVIKRLKLDGWYEIACDGDHHQFKHPIKKGRVTVTHPKKRYPCGNTPEHRKTGRNHIPINLLSIGGMHHAEKPLFLRRGTYL